jgi:hypothetical protein
VGVVDGFETVKVNKQQRHIGFGALCTGKCHA